MAKKLSDLIGQFATIPNSFILASTALSTESKWLFVILRYHTNSKTGNAFPSYTTIQGMTGFHRKTIAKALKELEQAGWLTKQRRFGATTIYALQLPSSSICDTTEGAASSSPSDTVISSISATISSSDGVHANQTEEETRLKEPDKKPSAHAELMDFLSTRIGHIPNGGQQGKCVKWLLERYDPVECFGCFNFLAAQAWRSTPVTWVTVQSNIGSWITKRPLSPHEAGIPEKLLPLPNGVRKWHCAKCRFEILQNGNGITNCPDCNGELI